MNGIRNIPIDFNKLGIWGSWRRAVWHPSTGNTSPYFLARSIAVVGAEFITDEQKQIAMTKAAVTLMGRSGGSIQSQDFELNLYTTEAFLAAEQTADLVIVLSPQGVQDEKLAAKLSQENSKPHFVAVMARERGGVVKSPLAQDFSDVSYASEKVPGYENLYVYMLEFSSSWQPTQSLQGQQQTLCL